MNNLMIFRNDLRLNDNVTLDIALEHSEKLLLVYVLEDRLIGKSVNGIDRMGPFRSKFLLESLESLKQSIESLGGRIYFAKGNYLDLLPELIPTFKPKQVFLTKEYTSEEMSAETNLRKIAEVKSFHNLTAFHPKDIPFDNPEHIPNQFTAFRKQIEISTEIRKSIPPVKNLSSTHICIETSSSKFLFESPKPLFENFSMGFSVPPDTAFPFYGGEAAGLRRVQDYIFQSQRIDTYSSTRNGLVGSEYSTKFSPWLANGSLSARSIWNLVLQYEAEYGATNSTYKVKFELLWRDYFKFLSIRHGRKIFWYSGLKPQSPDFSRDLPRFQSWVDGETGDQFVNANMKELHRTGWMSNRGRQIVASYLTKDLFVDWRLGAEHFEKYLLDYDVCSNYCNWQYQAGVGVDTRQYRKFNPKLQAEKYDKHGVYRKMWLGEDFNKGLSENTLF